MNNRKCMSLKEQQKRLTEMLLEFDAFCCKSKIQYYLGFGSLLGAIRHNGFIPWDDDIDILMPRESYELLMNIERISDTIDVVSYRSKKYYHPFTHINLVDTNTYRVSESTRKQTGQGLFIDVFPLDVVPSDVKERKRFTGQLQMLSRIRTYRIARFSSLHAPIDMLRNIVSLFCIPFNPLKMAQKVDDISKNYTEKDITYVGVLWLLRNAYWRKECFSNTLRWSFENGTVNIPSGYDEILREFYGDYMIPPDPKDRVCKHPAVVYTKS